jgi:hypothetical protein
MSPAARVDLTAHLAFTRKPEQLCGDKAVTATLDRGVRLKVRKREDAMTFCGRRSGARAWARTSRWTAARCLSTLACAVMLLSMACVPASAQVRVFLGFGLPVYPYPYVYSYAPPPPPYYAYPPPYLGYAPYVGYAAPLPPGWVAGHWAWRRGPWGHRARVWVAPAHLR